MTSPWTSLEIAKFAASLAGPIVTIFGFGFVWLQLKNTNLQIKIARDGLQASQDWKRAEFVASEFKEFYRDAVVMKVLGMVDYYDRKYDIGIKYKDGNPRLTRIVHSKSAERKLRKKTSGDARSLVSIEAALGPSDEYTDEETTIRDYFDTFLYYIERFESFLKADNLISEKEILPYLQYYIRIFRGELAHVNPAMLKSFRAYLKDFHFEGAEHFLYSRFIVAEKA
jgi:hypothetical protein